MVVVRTRMLHGEMVLGSPTKPYAEDVRLSVVVDSALATLRNPELFELERLDVFPDSYEVMRTRSEFAAEDLAAVSLMEMRACGLFFVATASFT